MMLDWELNLDNQTFRGRSWVPYGLIRTLGKSSAVSVQGYERIVIPLRFVVLYFEY